MENSQIKLLDNGNLLITLPSVLKQCGQRKQLVTPDSENLELPPLLINIARAYHWQKLIDQGKYENIKALSKALGMNSCAVARIIRLTLLSPKIVHGIINGELELTLDQCRQCFPDDWEEQDAFFFPQ